MAIDAMRVSRCVLLSAPALLLCVSDCRDSAFLYFYVCNFTPPLTLTGSNNRHAVSWCSLSPRVLPC